MLYHFAWDEVCDWYIELAKLSLGGPSGDATRRVLGEVLDVLLRLLHPMVPFVTEQLWTALTGGESVVIASWPVAGRRPRGARRRAPTSPSCRPSSPRCAASAPTRASSRRRRCRRSVTGAAERHRARDPRRCCASTSRGRDFTATASITTANGVEIAFDLSGAIDVAAERARLTKARAAAEKERATNAGKLGNEAFTGKAPDAVVAKVRDRLAAAEAELARIDAALDALPPA